MKAAVIRGPRLISYDTVPDPVIKDDRDVILKVTATAICGSDLSQVAHAYDIFKKKEDNCVKVVMDPRLE